MKVVSGERFIILQSNRPMLEREEAKKPIDWKILEGDIATGDPKKITLQSTRSSWRLKTK